MVKNLSDPDLDDFDGDFALFLLDYTPRVVNLGFMRNLKRFGYSRKPRPLICPICGGEMAIVRNDFGEAVLFDRPPPDAPSLYRNRGGIWEKYDASGQPGLTPLTPNE